MFTIFLIFVATASVLAGNTIAVEETSTKLPDVSGNLGEVSNTSSHRPEPTNQNSNVGTKNQTSATNPDSATVPSNTTDENKIDHSNGIANITTDHDIVIDSNNTASNTVNGNTVNNTISKNNLDSNIGNETANINVSNDNITAINNTHDSNTVNNTAANQQNSTGEHPALNNSNTILNDTNKPMNGSSTVSDQQTTPAIPIDEHLHQGNISNTGVQRNVSKIDKNENATKNVSTTSNQSSIIHSDVPKLEAILITAVVVVVGCCAVILVKRSLRSERGQAWLERTRRQANVPCRDYEVQYLVIKDSDD